MARLSETTAKEAGVAAGGTVTIRSEHGELTLPVVVTADLPDRVVWVPLHSPGTHVHESLRVTPGAVVRISAGAPDE